MSSNLGDELYSGAASFGQAWALISAVVITVLCVFVIIGGIYVIIHSNDYVSVPGKVTLINGSPTGQCKSVISSTGTDYKCVVTIQYVYDGQTKTYDVTYPGSHLFYIGELTKIYVNKKNPYKVNLDGTFPVTFGVGMILGAILIACISWFWFWATRRWKFVAAAEGVSGAFNIIRS